MHQKVVVVGSQLVHRIMHQKVVVVGSQLVHWISTKRWWLE